MPIRNPDPGGFLPDEPGGIGTTEPASPGDYLTYSFLGYDAAGLDVYRGSDGNLYRGDPNGPNGFSPYSGSEAGLSPTPPSTTQAGDEPIAPATPPPTTPPPPTGTGGTGTGTAFDPYPGTFTPPSTTLPGAPVYEAPKFDAPPMFAAPTLEQAMGTPGYQFRLGEGTRALQNAAAAKGVLRTGGSLKDLLAYGQNYATNTYKDVFDQALTTYKTNYGVTSDVYDKMADAAKLNYTGQLAGYQNQVRGNELDYARAWDRYLTDYNQWKRDQEWKYGVLKDQQTLGYDAARS